MTQFSSQLLLKLKEINDVTQNFYGLKQCQRNNCIQNMAHVNRPKDEQLCLLSETTTISEKVIWLNMHL